MSAKESILKLREKMSTSIIGQEKFIFQKGPIFSNLILVDEINRSPAKVQYDSDRLDD